MDTSKTYIASCNLINANITIVVRTSSGQFSLTSSNKQNKLPQGAEYIQQIFISLPQGLTFDGIISLQVSIGDNVPPYIPYMSQPFTYTPTNPMYSTQDGSISDYVDVEKGAEVYNMSGAVIYDGSEDEKWYPYVSGSYNGFVITNVTPSLKKGID